MTEHASLPGVSWWHVIVALEQRGYSHAAIAAAIGVSRQAVECWKNRFNEPGHETGERMVSLWCAVLPAAREDIPRREAQVLSASSFR